MYVYTHCNTVLDCRDFTKISAVESGDDNWAIVIHYCREASPYEVLGIYDERITAQCIIKEMYDAMKTGDLFYSMPPDEEDIFLA